MKEIKTFQQMYRDGHVNRREFLAAMGALGVTAATAGSFLTRLDLKNVIFELFL